MVPAAQHDVNRRPARNKMPRKKHEAIDGRALQPETYASILDALPFAVYALDDNLTIRYNNGRHALLEFVTDEEAPPPPALLGSNLMDHVPSSEREALGRLLREVLQRDPGERSGETRGVEFLHASSAGLKRLRVLATPIDESKEGLAVLLTCHESAVQPVSAGTSASPDRSPEGTRLDVARQLAATLNHEINNPLFVVSATLEDLLAEANTDDAAAQRRLRAALDSVWRVASAVKQLQDIRQIVTTAYIEGLPMVDLDASGRAEHGEAE
jgi:His Kinase A (phosphoacceptor) domain.